MAFPNLLTRMVLDPLRALAFLSRVPVSARLFPENREIAVSGLAWAFPLAGLLIILPACLLLIGLGDLAETATGGLLAASLAVVITIIVTGALHEDGLADVADGFWGGSSPQRRLEIMKDSATGAYGALALTGSVLLRVSALAHLLALHGAAAGMAALLVTAAASRALMVVHWSALSAARPDGVAGGAGQPGTGSAAVALVLAVGIAILCASLSPVTWIAMLTAIAAGVLVMIGFSAICRAKIAGHTGDTIGATQQLCEIALLAALAITL